MCYNLSKSLKNRMCKHVVPKTLHKTIWVHSLTENFICDGGCCKLKPCHPTCDTHSHGVFTQGVRRLERPGIRCIYLQLMIAAIFDPKSWSSSSGNVNFVQQKRGKRDVFCIVGIFRHKKKFPISSFLSHGATTTALHKVSHLHPLTEGLWLTEPSFFIIHV